MLRPAFRADLSEHDRPPISSAARAPQGEELVVGVSDVMRYVMSRVEQVADTDANVLLCGETGTGKELIARAIHRQSPRRTRPFVVVNCAAMPATLIESELFGRERGAFTGAHTSQIGRFELANKGTILLDEVGELPLDVQPKLLRVLQEGQIERLGSPRTVDVDVRVSPRARPTGVGDIDSTVPATRSCCNGAAGSLDACTRAVAQVVSDSTRFRATKGRGGITGFRSSRSRERRLK